MPQTQTDIQQEIEKPAPPIPQPEKIPTEIPVEEEKVSTMEAIRAGMFSSPAGFMMMTIAVSVDAGEFLVEFIPFVGTAISIFLDIFALLFIGGWMLARSGGQRMPKLKTIKMAKHLKWSKRLRWMRFVLPGVEMIPMGSSILPFWIATVYFELKYG